MFTGGTIRLLTHGHMPAWCTLPQSLFGGLNGIQKGRTPTRCLRNGQGFRVGFLTRPTRVPSKKHMKGSSNRKSANKDGIFFWFPFRHRLRRLSLNKNCHTQLSFFSQVLLDGLSLLLAPFTSANGWAHRHGCRRALAGNLFGGETGPGFHQVFAGFTRFPEVSSGFPPDFHLSPGASQVFRWTPP